MRWTILACCLVNLLLEFVSECSCNSLLLLKQRLRLEHLFHYEVSQCLQSASFLSPGLWSVPTSITDIDNITVRPKSLISVRSVAKSIAFATSPAGLIDVVRSMHIQQPLPWTIEYECLTPLESEAPALKNEGHNNGEVTQTDNNIQDDIGQTLQSPFSQRSTPDIDREETGQQRSVPSVDRKSFSSKTLFCSLSQCINGAPALDTREAEVFYYIFETQKGFHFGSSTESLNSLDVRSKSMDKSIGKITAGVSQASAAQLGVKELWAGRPFIFSASLNIEIAGAVMNILQAKLRAKQSDSVSEGKGEGSVGTEAGSADRVFTVLDPCCGSGTTLLVARRLGFRAIGSDVNAAFVAGAAANLKYAGHSLHADVGADHAAASTAAAIGATAASTAASIGATAAATAAAAAVDNIVNTNAVGAGADGSSTVIVQSQDSSTALLQLFIKDAACAVSAWKPYVQATSDVKACSGGDADQRPYTEQPEAEKVLESSSELPKGQYKEIPTVGRTQRFLKEKMAPRSDTQSAISGPKTPWGMVDCVFCNFPWGENIFEYYNETENILTVLGKGLKSGCECAFITKKPLCKEVLLERGFIVKEEVPIRDDTKKGKKSSFSNPRSSGRESNAAYGNDDKDNTGDCSVTFAVVV